MRDSEKGCTWETDDMKLKWRKSSTRKRAICRNQTFRNKVLERRSLNILAQFPKRPSERWGWKKNRQYFLKCKVLNPTQGIHLFASVTVRSWRDVLLSHSFQFLIYLGVWRNEQWSQDFTDETTSSLLSWRAQTKGKLMRQVTAAISAHDLAFGLG